MTRRIDYWHDPEAPTPTRIVPGGGALIVDEVGRILLQRRADSGNWSMPGGVMEVGETLPQAVVREVAEETGIQVELTGMVGTFTDPAHVIAYADGEVRQEFVVLYLGRPVGGTLAMSDESTDAWIAPDALDSLQMHESVRYRLSHWRNGTVPHLG
jgi:8-oxo-dGTP pyrophosphatase MutT (NUDIX family)